MRVAAVGSAATTLRVSSEQAVQPPAVERLADDEVGPGQGGVGVAAHPGVGVSTTLSGQSSYSDGHSGGQGLGGARQGGRGS